MLLLIIVRLRIAAIAVTLVLMEDMRLAPCIVRFRRSAHP
jgi:hypothetical protein